MKTITREYNVYKIEELEKKVQEKAYNDWYSNSEYPWNDDNKSVLDSFCDKFPVKIHDWEYGYQNYINFCTTCDQEIDELKGIRLMKYISNNYSDYIFKGKYYSTKGYYDEKKQYHYKYRHSNIILEKENCPLTGYYIDNEILQPLWDFLDKPDKIKTFHDLMEECLDNWISACNRNYENYYSMENFLEESKANEYEYLESGKQFN